MKQLLIRILFLCFLLHVQSACSPTAYLSKQNLNPYPLTGDIYYRIYHLETHSELALELSNCTCRITARLFDAQKNKLPIEEKTITIELKELTIVQLPLKGLALDGFLEIIVTDNTTRNVFHSIAAWSKRKNSNQNISFWINDLPVVKPYVTTIPLSGVVVKNRFNENMRLRFYGQKMPPAAPPYSFKANVLDDSETATSLMQLHSGDFFELALFGLYRVDIDNLPDAQSIFLNFFDTDFPKLTHIDELILATRYITKNKEYDAMNRSKKKKETLDNFWLDRSNNKEIAKNQISIYYSRIQKANQFFTKYKEGWKTDKGMIYTIFGSPNSIKRIGNLEYWYYNQKIYRPSVEFVFVVGLEYDTLIRRSEYELFWGSEILRWREALVE